MQAASRRVMHSPRVRAAMTGAVSPPSPSSPVKHAETYFTGNASFGTQPRCCTATPMTIDDAPMPRATSALSGPYHPLTPALRPAVNAAANPMEFSRAASTEYLPPPDQSPMRTLGVRSPNAVSPMLKCRPAPLQRGLTPTSPYTTHAESPSAESLAHAVASGVESGRLFLRLANDGAGGTYFVIPRRDPNAAPLAVFKPSDEEVGADDNPRGNNTDDDVRDGFTPGDGWKREVLAYELDHQRFAGVPETVEVTIDGRVGSLQRFVPRMIQSWSTTPAKFDTASVHHIAVFDLRTLNCDRHGGNILVLKDQPSFAAVPIDHSFIAPDGWADPDFEWALWPQAKQPVSDGVRDYVANLNADDDAALVASRLSVEAGEIVAVTTRVLKCALAHGKSYTLMDVANFCRRATLVDPSELEQLLAACRRDLDDGGDLDFDRVEAQLADRFP